MNQTTAFDSVIPEKEQPNDSEVASGAYGWQFNVVFGENGKVSKVDRRWIH
jgi:hypothetical protein